MRLALVQMENAGTWEENRKKAFMRFKRQQNRMLTLFCFQRCI